MHAKKVREGGCTHTRMSARDLFAAIDKYKKEEGVYEGMITNDPVNCLNEQYEEGARAVVFEESRAVTGLRNAVAAVRDTIPTRKIREIGPNTKEISWP